MQPKLEEYRQQLDKWPDGPHQKNAFEPREVQPDRMIQRGKEEFASLNLKNTNLS